MSFIINLEIMICSATLIIIFMIIDLFITTHYKTKIWESELGTIITDLKRENFELYSQLIKEENYWKAKYEEGCETFTIEDKVAKVEPDYYDHNGLSPIGAFKQGLISMTELTGFYKANIIKYVVRFQNKENPVQDLRKARDYIDFLLDIYEE